jgi:hypothetical protein
VSTSKNDLQSNVRHPAIVKLWERRVWNIHGLMTPKGLEVRTWRCYQVHDRWYRDHGMSHIHERVRMMGMHLRHPIRWVIGNIVPKIPDVVALIRPSCGYYEEKVINLIALLKR